MSRKTRSTPQCTLYLHLRRESLQGTWCIRKSTISGSARQARYARPWQGDGDRHGGYPVIFYLLPRPRVSWRSGLGDFGTLQSCDCRLEQLRSLVWSVATVLPLSSAGYVVCSMFGGTRSMTRTRDEMIYRLSLCILHDMTSRRIDRTCRLVTTVLRRVQRA